MEHHPGLAKSLADGSAKPTKLDLRQFLRRKVSAAGSLRYGGRGYRVRVENISERGCQFWIPRRMGLPLGKGIALYIEDVGPFPATVRWSRDGWIGVEFVLPVYTPVLDHLSETLAPTSDR